jgi:hypothetical protein
MARAKLFNRLLVKITKQRSPALSGPAKPKAGSRGWVACFDRDAAIEIVKHLNRFPNAGPIFNFGNDWYFKRWRREGYPGLSLKDLRRASLYWLGHYTSLEISALKNHARHKSIMTTALYTRRPFEEIVSRSGTLDLDS